MTSGVRGVTLTSLILDRFSATPNDQATRPTLRISAIKTMPNFTENQGGVFLLTSKIAKKNTYNNVVPVNCETSQASFF